MALLHPEDRFSTVRTRNRTTAKGGIHPAICLLSGFGFIVASALAVHVIFNALI
ncbi:hypothetical protein [Brevundimonas sp. R86498]|uniref:hypothetical protein n=1 Tax=Brevundimonas sp. R86498 TaxID=3093845 RepID=UPI0037CBD6C1